MPCTRELFLIFISSAILTFVIFQRLLLRPLRDDPNHSPRIETTTSSTLTSVRALLAPRGISHTQLIGERAKANGHLARTLGLTNGFVDPDPQVHAEFVQHARGLLKNAQSYGWTRFHEICNSAVLFTIDEYPSTTSTKTGQDIPFDHFVQIVVLRTILAGFLNVGKDVDELDTSSLALVTSSINELWTLSKSGIIPPSELSERLHYHLRQLVPMQSGLTNPIDFVVPTWETMWRVCATTIARTQEAGEYETIFHDFLQADASIAQQFNTAGEQGFSVKDFIEESMRLHPPVKRISRLRDSTTDIIPPKNAIFARIHSWIHRPQVQTDVPARQVANIEAVLRDREIWSDDGHIFNPRRYQRSNQRMRESLKLIFGHGPLRCIAASWSPIGAAVICATIMSGCREKGWKVIPGDEIGGRLGWDGWRVVKCSGRA